MIQITSTDQAGLSAEGQYALGELFQLLAEAHDLGQPWAELADVCQRLAAICQRQAKIHNRPSAVGHSPSDVIDLREITHAPPTT